MSTIIQLWNQNQEHSLIKSQISSQQLLCLSNNFESSSPYIPYSVNVQFGKSFKQDTNSFTNTFPKSKRFKWNNTRTVNVYTVLLLHLINYERKISGNLLKIVLKEQQWSINETHATIYTLVHLHTCSLANTHK